MTVRSTDGPPTIEDAARQLGVPVTALDRVFGVVTIDPKQGLYSVQVDANHLPAGALVEEFAGPFSDPPIEPFGAPRDATPPGKKST